MSVLASKICAACAEFIISPAITEPHALMIHQGKRNQLLSQTHMHQYHCLECEATWLVKRSDEPESSLRPIQHSADARFRAGNVQRLHQAQFLPEGAASIA